MVIIHKNQLLVFLHKITYSPPEAEVGTTVLLAIPDVDKGRCELPNLKCVVLEKTGGGMYRYTLDKFKIIKVLFEFY